MSERIEGLFLRSTKIKHNSIIVDILTANYGRCSFVFPLSNKKNTSFLFQPFHFIEFSSGFNNEKKLNRASSAEIVFPVINIISDIRKTGYAMLLTEIMNKIIHQQEKNLNLYLALKKMILYFENQSFNAVFGVFFIKELLSFFGIQPINNFNPNRLFFNIEDGKFSSLENENMTQQFPNEAFSSLLGTKIDEILTYKISTTNRRQIMDVLLKYMQYHGLINTEKINSIKVLQSLYD